MCYSVQGRSEDTLPESVLFFHCVGPRDWTRLSGLVAGTFTRWDILPPCIHFLKFIFFKSSFKFTARLSRSLRFLIYALPSHVRPVPPSLPLSLLSSPLPFSLLSSLSPSLPPSLMLLNHVNSRHIHNFYLQSLWTIMFYFFLSFQ